MLKKLLIPTVGITALTSSLYGVSVENISFYKEVKNYKKHELSEEHRNALVKEALAAVENKSGLILDFRSEDEKNAGKIPGSYEVRADHFTKELDSIIKKDHIKNIDTVYLVCRTGSRAAYQTMAWDKLMEHIQKTKPNFNIVAKTLSLKDYATSCKGIESLDDDPNATHLAAKKVFLKPATNGLYYSDKCTNIQFK